MDPAKPFFHADDAPLSPDLSDCEEDAAYPSAIEGIVALPAEPAQPSVDLALAVCGGSDRAQEISRECAKLDSLIEVAEGIEGQHQEISRRRG